MVPFVLSRSLSTYPSGVALITKWCAETVGSVRTRSFAPDVPTENSGPSQTAILPASGPVVTWTRNRRYRNSDVRPGRACVPLMASKHTGKPGGGRLVHRLAGVSSIVAPAALTGGPGLQVAHARVGWSLRSHEANLHDLRHRSR